MCWADKIGLFVYLAWVGFLYALTGLLPFDDWDRLKFSLLPTLPIWLILRFLDLITGGPARRRGQIIVRRLN